MAKLKDSGARTTFESGAQRELIKEKGRHDLLPLDVLSDLYASCPYHSDQVNELGQSIFSKLNGFIYSGDCRLLFNVIWDFIEYRYANNVQLALQELAIHYGDGADKYEARNWEKGLPLSSLLQSAIRHFVCFLENWEDEPHDRAFMWNIFGMLCMIKRNRTDLFDLPFYQQSINTDNSHNLL